MLRQPSGLLLAGWLRSAAAKQLFVRVNRPYLLLILPLALAIGYSSGKLLHETPETVSPEQAPDKQSREQSSVYQQKRDLWRARFLKLLEEPSFSLQSSRYYALARTVQIAEMPYLLEGMYPEGWTRFRGDLPLALFMEWAKKDSSGLAVFTEQLLTQYPDLKDNLDGVYFNLGLQNAPGAIPTLEGISDPGTRSFLNNKFLSGLRSEYPEEVFSARLRLLGPEATFSKLSDVELEQAILEYWTYSNRYKDSNITVDPSLAMELGKRYHEKGIDLIDTSSRVDIAIIGSIVATRTASTETIDRINTMWFNWNEIEKLLSKEEKRTLIAFLAPQEEFWKKNQSNIGPKILSDALDHELTERLIDLPYLPTWTRNLVISNAAKLYSQERYFNLLGRFDEETRSVGLHKLIANKSSQASLALLKDLPQEWRDSSLINEGMEEALRSGNKSNFDEICELFPEHINYLPNGELTSNALWQINPELYLSRIELLEDGLKKHHLGMIASYAEEEELGMILESGSFNQQTDVLINLIHEKPILSTEILKHEDPDLITPNQASRIGVSLAYSADKETSLSFFKASDISHKSVQIAVLNFYLCEGMMDEKIKGTSALAQITPQHDYLFRAATVFQDETDNPEHLLALKQENPKAFITAITSLIKKPNEGSLRTRAKHLLASPSLSSQEKLEIHNALYGGGNS